jgi:hypothetical protein
MPKPSRTSLEIPVNSGTRVRISRDWALAIGANESHNEIEFIGFFRRPAELVCAPAGNAIEGQPTLNAILRQIPAIEAQDELLPIELLPSTAQLVLPDRLVQFSGTWAGDKRQLNLNVGSKWLAPLAYDREGSQVVRIIVRNRFLILMSDAHYSSAAAEPVQFSV